jgi:hypothetical protein
MPKRPRPKRYHGEPLVQHNCHFPGNTLAALRLHAALTDSGGVSGLVRQVMEYYLSTGINWKDPRYVEIEPVKIPPDLYPGHNIKLGLA